LSRDRKHIKIGIIVGIGLIVIIPILWFFATRLEGQAPTIALDLPSAFIGKSQEIAVSVADAKSGIRKIWVGLIKDGKEVTLHAADYPAAWIFGRGKEHDKVIKLQVAPGQLGFSDGDAILRVTAWDYSWRNWLSGNRTYFEQNLTIDTRSPQIEIFSSAHNVSQGGAGLVIYQVSEPCAKSGVYIGDRFFPGHSGFAKDPNILAALFALGYDQSPETKIFVEAVDRAGNEARAGIQHYFRHKVFRKDTIDISDTFLDRKLPEFSTELTHLQAAGVLDKFLFINRDLRRANYETIREVCQKTDPVFLWQGSFLRLPKSAPQARFADQRTYRYNGRVIDHQVHLGVDLASVKHSEVPAANNGMVVFAETLGIYGKTVIIDHGLGLFSMYSHLSQISVNVGEKVSRGDVLGRTGATGLAGGDHLHFSIIVHDSFVNPIEWWDASWIENNISTKIDTVGSQSKQE